MYVSYFLWSKRELERDSNDELFGWQVLGHGTAVFEDLATYLDSLDRMRHQFTGRGYPAHGAVIEDGRARIAEYIKHRQQREDEIIRVLKYGTLTPPEKPDENLQRKSWTSIELVKVIYHDVPENLHEPAEKGVIMVLKKLAGEGKVSQGEDGRWKLIGRSAL
jgi:ribonuclease/clavin/mitogillin